MSVSTFGCRGKAYPSLREGGYNHYRGAQALIPLLNDGSLTAADLDRFGELFARLNSALS